MKKFSELLISAIQKKDRWKAQVAANWSEVIGEALKNHVHLLGFDKNKILLLVNNACLAQEISLRKKEFLIKFNNYVNSKTGNTVSDIAIMKIGKHAPKKSPLKRHTEALRANNTTISENASLPDLENATFTNKEHQALFAIKTAGLQKQLSSLLLRCKQREFKHVDYSPVSLLNKYSGQKTIFANRCRRQTQTPITAKPGRKKQ